MDRILRLIFCAHLAAVCLLAVAPLRADILDGLGAIGAGEASGDAGTYPAILQQLRGLNYGGAGLPYALGYATNPVLQRATAQALGDLELSHRFDGRREPVVQRFESLDDYRADSWPHPRRVVAKVEVTPQGSQRRFVVTNLPGTPQAVYRDFYVKRGKVPEQPIGEFLDLLGIDDTLSDLDFDAIDELGGEEMAERGIELGPLLLVRTK